MRMQRVHIKLKRGTLNVTDSPIDSHQRPPKEGLCCLSDVLASANCFQTSAPSGAHRKWSLSSIDEKQLLPSVLGKIVTELLPKLFNQVVSQCRDWVDWRLPRWEGTTQYAVCHRPSEWHIFQAGALARYHLYTRWLKVRYRNMANITSTFRQAKLIIIYILYTYNTS